MMGRMSVAVLESTLVRYNVSGTEYAIPFPFTGDDIAVLLENNEGGQETPSGWTITGNLLTLSVAPTSWDTITIYRITPLSQTLDLSYNEGLTLDLIERALDKLTRAAQEERYGQASLKFPVTEDPSGQDLLPPAPIRANTVMFFNEYGTLELISLVDLQAKLNAL